MSKAQRPVEDHIADTAKMQTRELHNLGNAVVSNFTTRSIQVLTHVPTDADFGLTVGSRNSPRIPQLALRNNAGAFSLYVRCTPETRDTTLVLGLPGPDYGKVTVLGTWKSVALA